MHDFKFVLGNHLLLKQGTLRNFWVFPSWLKPSSSFFHSVPQIKTLCTLYLINFYFYLQKPVRLLNSNDSCVRKKYHCKDRSSKLFLSKGTQNNLPRSNFHCCGYHRCYLRKPKKLKNNYLMQSNAHLVRAFSNIIWNQWGLRNGV